MLESKLYYECHVTVEPVFEDDRFPDGTFQLDAFDEICLATGFRRAALLMQKRRVDTQIRSKDDTFCTTRGRVYDDVQDRMIILIKSLRERGFVVWRYKIEDTIIDSKIEDVLGLI